MGLGVPDPKGIFGTTSGLQQKFGSNRVFDMPTSESGMTGVAIGSAIVGMRPIMVHQRVEFSMLAFEQILNQASNWHYMCDGRSQLPLVIRMLIGRGWGQGPQHSQSLHGVFTHFPGLKVVMPATPSDAKGLLIAAVEDNNPVIYLEHRWLHPLFGHVPEGDYKIPIGKARIARSGDSITIVASSYMTIESLRAAEFLARDGIDAEVIDLMTLQPLDRDLIIASVRKTRHLLVVDADWRTMGFAAEVITSVIERAYDALLTAPRRVTLPDVPSPSSPGLTRYYYPRPIHIINEVREMLRYPQKTEKELGILQDIPLDIPNLTFKGPF